MDEEFPVQGLEQRFESGPRVIRIPKKINLKKKECWNVQFCEPQKAVVISEAHKMVWVKTLRTDTGTETGTETMYIKSVLLQQLTVSQFIIKFPLFARTQNSKTLSR